jgi:hypothetical protein
MTPTLAQAYSADMTFARIGCAVAVVWLAAMLALSGVLLWANSCDSERCNGPWFVSIILLAYGSVAGLVVVPIGIWSGARLAYALAQRAGSEADPSRQSDSR